MTLKKYIYTLIFFFAIPFAFGQPPEDLPDTEVPIDSSLVYLVTSGIMLGAGYLKFNLRRK